VVVVVVVMYDKISSRVIPAGNVCGVGTSKDTASNDGCIHALCTWDDIFPCHKIAEKFCQQQQLVVIRKFPQKLIFSSIWFGIHSRANSIPRSAIGSPVDILSVIASANVPFLPFFALWVAALIGEKMPSAD
jgi:hypothetical protein